MKKFLSNFIGEKIGLEISGKKVLSGVLIDIGSDVIVLFNGKDFLYLPAVHIQNISMINSEEIVINPPTESPSIEHEDEISLRKTLNVAKGMFTEIYISGNQPLHGYITSIMNNYFVFYSPVYKTMLISLHHLKWLIPYTANQIPYSLSNHQLPLNPVKISLARSLEVQIHKMSGELVIFNIGESSHVIGKMNGLEDNFVELITARQEIIYINLQHIKTVHFANS